MSSSSADQTKSASTSSFITALWINAVVFAIEIIAFTFLRNRFRAVYQPRTLSPIKTKRVEELPRGLLAWPMAIIKADYTNIQGVNGMDAYFYVRFLRMMCKIFLPIWLISWAVLMPITSVHTSVVGKSGLDKFTLGNISPNRTDRYAAHLILAWVFTFWIWYVIKGEMTHFIRTRQHHLISPDHASSVQATTVLVTGIPAKYLSEKALLQMYSQLPGGVKKVWLNRDLKELPTVFNRRASAVNKLENAENSLLKMAYKLRNKKLKAEAKANKKSGNDTAPTVDAEGRTLTRASDEVEGNVSLAEKLVPKGKRPSHRLPAGFMPFALPFIGQKVDTIEWARNEVELTSGLLEKGRGRIGVDPVPAAPRSSDSLSEHTDGDVKSDKKTEKAEKKAAAKADKENGEEISESYPPVNSAFITFNTQIAAHMAKNALNHHEPYRMTGRYAEVAPEDVIWSNLGMNAYEAKVRKLISYGITAALIIFWAIPVAFVGSISNIHSLCKQFVWLSWLCDLPGTVLGIIQGILPAVLLAVLMMLLPIVLRLLARFEGIPKRTGLELSLMTRFFIFQVVHSFLLLTISSGLIASAQQIINNPSSAATLLANNLPAASTFFLTYILLQGLTGTAGGFLQAVTLILYYIKLVILGSTPRSIYNLKFGARTVAWGTLFPLTTLIMVIGVGYMVIAPIINGLVFCCFALFFFLYKYLFLWVFEMPKSSDTGGLFFPKAIQHVFVGLYVQQVCLAALFFLAQDENKKQAAIPEGALMIVLIIFTIFFNMMINDSYGPLIHSLPLSLADRVGEAPAGSDASRMVATEESRKLAISADPEAQDAAGPHKGKEVDPVSEDMEAENNMRTQAPVDYGFAHPAASRPQRTIWMAQDTLGLTNEEVAANRERGIDISTHDATIDDKGKVDITGPPPDEESRA